MISSGEKSGELVDVKYIALNFHIEHLIVKAVDGVNFQIEKSSWQSSYLGTNLMSNITPNFSLTRVKKCS